jgi:glycosyltransferase involved in cell wall biosynthesis
MNIIDKNPLVSVIVPVFNAGKYLEQCILSILSQSLQEIEVIAVNDGSTDNSGEILDKIAQHDSRLYVFHCENKGVSAARNFGIYKTNSAYIGFVDADDWIEPDMYEKMYNAAQENKSEWVICNISIHYASDSVGSRLKIVSGTVQINEKTPNFIENLMQFDYDFANWNKLFSAKLIQGNDIRFNEKMYLWEDLLFNLIYLQYVKKISFLNEDLYHYRVLPSSLTNDSKESMIDQNNQLFMNYFSFANKRETKNELEVFRKQMAKRCYNFLFNEIAVNANNTTSNLFSFFKKYHKAISKINSDIFYYQYELKFGFQGMKKYMLIKKWIFPFVFLSAINFKLKEYLK